MFSILRTKALTFTLESQTASFDGKSFENISRLFLYCKSCVYIDSLIAENSETVICVQLENICQDPKCFVIR